MSCCHHQWFHKIFDFIGYQDFEIILGVFLVSVFGSFIHCIGMCGPIASARYSMKLMKSDLLESKLKMSLDYSYYIGKTLSYLCISSILYFISFKLKEIFFAKYIIFIALLAVSLAFLFSAINFSFINKFSTGITRYSYLSRVAKNFNWFSGFILGFIPCGYLYAILAMVSLKSESYFTVVIATLIFGVGTVPGLFLVAYCGNAILLKYKKLFKLFFKSSMVVNAILICKYAIKIL